MEEEHSPMGIFLRSMCTAEKVLAHADLREAISTETPLVLAVVDAVTAGRDVVVTGSAGGGKTHILNDVLDLLTSNELKCYRFGDDEEPDEGPFLRWHEDGTKLTPEDRSRLFDGLPVGASVLIAINEGPLRALAGEGLAVTQTRTERVFSAARDTLRLAQQGTWGNDATREDAPVVVDAAGFDVVSDLNALSSLLLNESVSEVVRAEITDNGHTSEWGLLKSETVRRRVQRIMRLASLDGEPVLWRQLWNLMGDMALKGSASEPWFARLVFGDSGVSKRIRKFFDVKKIALPQVDAALWEGGEAAAAELKRASDVSSPELPSAQAERSAEYRERLKQFRISQLRYLLCSIDEHPAFSKAVEVTPWVSEGITDARKQVIQRINRYRLYGTANQTLNTSLALNLIVHAEYSLRERSSTTQVILGQVKREQLEIVRSVAVAGMPTISPILGGRYFLQGPSQAGGPPASLRLTGDLWRSLGRQRSILRSDRVSRELDLDLDRFFYQLVTPGDQLKITHTDLSHMTTEHVEITVDGMALEWSPGGV